MQKQTWNNTDHPIAYVSALFRGSLNWAALTKESYVIYILVKKLRFYIDTAKVTIFHWKCFGEKHPKFQGEIE